MNIIDLIDLAPTFGAALVAVREKQGLRRVDLAQLMDLPESALRDIELGWKLGRPDTARVAGTVLGLTPQETKALTRRRTRERLTIQNADKCIECQDPRASRQMHPGPGSREDECRHVASCLDRIARYFPAATAAHCPPACARRDLVTREERLLEAIAHGGEDAVLPNNDETRRAA